MSNSALLAQANSETLPPVRHNFFLHSKRALTMTERQEYTPEMQAKARRVMADNLAEQLGEHLDRFLGRGMNHDDGMNLRNWLWHNKVGILRALQLCGDGVSEDGK